MTMSVALVGSGLHHAVATGTITQGAGFGEVAALGAAQLMRLRLPFSKSMSAVPGFADQLYITARSLDGNVSNVALNATQVTFDATGAILQLNVDISAFPASMYIAIEAHHSIGR